MNEAMQATPHSVLIEQLMDSRVPKTEREHAACREIEMLRKDAERYQWLRDRMQVRYERSLSGKTKEALSMRVGFDFLDCTLDIAIDAAIKKERGEK